MSNTALITALQKAIATAQALQVPSLPPPTIGIAIGDRIEVTIATGPRPTPLLAAVQGANQPVGARGTVTGGPVNADALVWWNVDFDTGADGWVREIRIKEVAGTVPTPVPTPVPIPAPTPQPTGETIAVDVATTYQTMRGWEAHARAWVVNKLTNAYDPTWRVHAPAVAQALVALGVNRLQFALRTGWMNPVDYWAQFAAGTLSYTAWKLQNYNTVSTSIYWSEFDFMAETMMVPMAAAMLARGEKLYLNLGVVDFNAASGGYLKTTLVNTDPALYATFVLACFDRLKTKYGVRADALELNNEPENTNWTGAQMGAALVAVKAKLEAAGYVGLNYIAPSHSSAGRTVATATAILGVAGASAALKTISYHRYDSPPAATIAAIEAFAKARGLETDMSEWINATVDTLIEDLTVGGNSSWQKWGIAISKQQNSANPQSFYLFCDVATGAITPAPNTAKMAAIMRYVRAGAVRVKATASNTAHKTLAFINANGRYVVIVKTSTPITTMLTGLKPGLYGVNRVSMSDVETGQPNVTVSADGRLPVALVAGVTTVYGR